MRVIDKAKQSKRTHKLPGAFGEKNNMTARKVLMVRPDNGMWLYRSHLPSQPFRTNQGTLHRRHK